MERKNTFNKRNLDHIRIDSSFAALPYAFPRRSFSSKKLHRDYQAHAQHLKQTLISALGDFPTQENDQGLKIEGLKPGALIEAVSLLPIKGERPSKISSSLDMPRKGIALLHSKRADSGQEKALLFIPDGQRSFLQEQLDKYAIEQRTKGGAQNAHAKKFEELEGFNNADARNLFIGKIDFTASEKMWWEIWIRNYSKKGNPASEIAQAAQREDIAIHEDRLIFPDTTILFLYDSVQVIQRFADRIPGALIQIRKSTNSIVTILDRSNHINQHDWVRDLANRISVAKDNAPRICLLDTGITANHPLIKPGLKANLSVDEAWGTYDHYPQGGHGTSLAGLSLYGDLSAPISDTRHIHLKHNIESIKYLPPPNVEPTEVKNYGTITQSAVSLVEQHTPKIQRSFCIASSTDQNSPSEPSSWSGAIDQIASGSMIGDMIENTSASQLPKRLLILSAGNTHVEGIHCLGQHSSIEDPAQSWNALTIGGFTRKESDGTPIKAFNLSPFSCSSNDLPYDLTPIKPEVLFEAGNMVFYPPEEVTPHTSVSLLTTGSSIHYQPLVDFWATSAATGMAGHFMGQLQATLPDMWPETYRALTVDSARWPNPMMEKFLNPQKSGWEGSMGSRQELVRQFGYGIPDIERACRSSRNSTTLIAQAEIQPYTNTGKKNCTFNEMHFYELPWPREALELLEDQIVTLKVTLSYFIEPNLSGKASTRPETYRSCGLRFAMKQSLENNEQFLGRVSDSQKIDGEKSANNDPGEWLLGTKSVNAGSLHCDLWRGYGSDLANHDCIAIFPVSGWWKTHTGKKRMEEKLRYALIISISSPEQEIDFYSEISNLVQTKEINISSEIDL